MNRRCIEDGQKATGSVRPTPRRPEDATSENDGEKTASQYRQNFIDIEYRKNEAHKIVYRDILDTGNARRVQTSRYDGVPFS